jgi:hypothetical protein
MPANNLQLLYNRLERSFAAAEETFLHAEKQRHELRSDYEALLAAVQAGKHDMARYPQAQLTKRLRLIETLLKDLQLRQAGEQRSFQALGFMLSRLRLRLASEILEPRLYGRIRAALAEEETLTALRKKYPDADAVLTEPARTRQPKKSKNIRLLLIGVNSLYYAIPVTRLVKKTAPGPVEAKLLETGFTALDLPGNRTSSHRMPLAIAFEDLAKRKRLIYCDEYFTPIEVPQKVLRRMVVWAPPADRFGADFRPQVKLYGRRFFVYGARLSYTVRPGERKHPAER